MYISTCLSVCPFGTQPSVCLFHLFHLSCSFSKLSMGIHCTMTHAFVRALQQGIRLAKRPHHLTTHLILNRLGRLGDPSEYPFQCSPYFHRATPVTRPSSWCVCPVVVLSWLDNLLNFFCMCLFASQVQIPAHHLPRLLRHLTVSRRKFPLKRRLSWTSTTLSIVFWSTALASVRRPPGPPVLLRGPMWPQHF